MDKEILEKLEDITGSLKELETARSELIEAVLAAFFRTKVNHVEKARELVTLKRKGLL